MAMKNILGKIMLLPTTVFQNAENIFREVDAIVDIEDIVL